MISHFIFYFSLAFDFKGTDDGGNVSQLISFVINIATAAYIILNEKSPIAVGRRYKLVGYLLIFHLLCTFVAALIQDVEIGRYLRVVLPNFLFVIGYFVGARSFAKFGFDKTIYLLTCASLVAVVFTICYGLSTGDFSNNGIRYQVLSPMLNILTPVLAHNIFISKKNVKVSTVLITAILILILISSTRSALIAYVGVVILALSISRAKSIGGLVIGGGRSLIFVTIFAAIALPILNFFMPEVISRFVERIFTSDEVGFDITSATRIAVIIQTPTSKTYKVG